MKFTTFTNQTYTNLLSMFMINNKFLQLDCRYITPCVAPYFIIIIVLRMFKYAVNILHSKCDI